MNDDKMIKRIHKEQINFQEEIKELVVCKYCTFETDNIDELDNHILNHFLGEDDVDIEDVIVLVDEPPPKKRPKKEVPDAYRCPHCKYETKRKHDLPKHLLTHSTPDATTLYKCSQCPYETKRKNDMPKHMLAHCTDVQMFKCPECPYQTKRKSDLPKHLLCHKPCGEVPLYKCDYCEYVTKRKGDLPKHVLNHKDDSNLQFYNCSECDYKTKRKNDLHKHMLVHCDRLVAGVFKCLKCIYATDKVNKFSRHVLSECTYCGDAIDMEHLMLEDIIGTVDEEDIILEECYAEAVAVEKYEDQQPYSEKVDDNKELVRVQIEQQQAQEKGPSQGFEDSEYTKYKMNDEITKANYREAVRRKHGVFKINLGEFSYENSSSNFNQGGHRKPKFVIENIAS